MAEIWSTAEKVAKLLLKEAESLHKVKHEVESVNKKLKSMSSKLKKADTMIDRDEKFDEWASDLRNLVFKAEDVFEVFVNNATPYDEEDGCATYFQLIMGCFHQISTLHKLKYEINDINGKLSKLEELSKQIPQMEKGSPEDREISSRHEGIDRVPSEIDEVDIVGFKKEEEDVTSWLTREEPRGRPVVFSIWAQGGAGKSTLAFKIYKSSIVRGEFDCVAWVSVSQEYHVKDIWQAILKEAGQLTPKEETEGILRQKVKVFLKERNYLIILDDVWKPEDLNIIQVHFPKSPQKKCRVLVTTRNEEVARVGGPNQLLNLRQLNPQESMDLFLKRVYPFSPEEIRSVPKEMKDLAGEMLSKWCEGLPIAIVLLGGILCSEEKDPIVWGNIRDKVHSDLVNEGGLRKLLALSYNQLPYELRSCFLYFGLFPEDSLINCDRLIRLWVAEGFLEQGDDHSEANKEDVAEKYLKRLIERSMIQLVERKSNGDPKRCRTHDLIRDLAMKEGKKAKFSSISMDKYVGSSSVQSSSRRIALHGTWSCTVPNQSKASSSGHPPSLTLQQPRPRVVDHEGDVDVVGLQKEADDLARWLTKEEPLGRLAVVSIVGDAGMGKTALARNVYNRNDVVSHFAYRAWVHVNDNSFEVKNILRTILQQVASSSTTLTDDDAEIQVNKEGEEESLQRMVHNLFLQGESYLIVFDNVLQQKYWDAIKMVFPNKPLNKDQKCRVLLTTRSKRVALHADLTTRDEEVARLDAHPTTCNEEVAPLYAHPTTCDGEVDEELAVDADSTTMFSGIITSDEEADLYDNLPASCCYLGCLNEELSLKLFLKTIFKCSQDEMPTEAFSEDMRIIATKLVENCYEKLPYAILALGGLLSREEKDVYLWNDILELLDFFRSCWIIYYETQGYDKKVTVMMVFSVCYFRLPHYLASCIRYFYSMPLESEISCDSLRQFWVDQGFLESRDNYSVEQVARDSLEELIQRKLIDVTEWRSNGDPQTCRMHRDFHEIILDELEVLDTFRMEEYSTGPKETINEVNGTSSTTTTTTTDTATGTDHQPKTFNLIHLLSKVLADPFHLPNHVYHSLLCFSKNHNLPLVLASREFHLLRVVDLQAGAENILELPIQIKNLALLRYLSLRGTRVEVIPTWIAKLRNLETLDAPASLIPVDTLKLHQLRHLFAHSFYSPTTKKSCDTSSNSSSSSNKFSCYIGDLEHLRTLKLFGDSSDWVIDGLDLLTNLRVLRLCVDNCDSVSNLTGLKFLHLTHNPPEFEVRYVGLPSFSRHDRLNEMILERSSSTPFALGSPFPMPNDLPRRLTFLWLDISVEDWMHPFSTLQKLPHLKKLCMRLHKLNHVEDWNNEIPIICSPDGFPEVEYLYVRAVEIYFPDWTVEPGALRSLRVLHIEGMHEFGNFPNGLAHIPNLKELIITRGYDVRGSILNRQGENWEKVKGIQASIKLLDDTSVNLPSSDS